ncbi:MAG TPA: hypothetical protein DEQ40_08065, partial [Oxalobacteraceae bacterium]|nr:hypothetical protein [Oxalobacteraceae bacterium]
MTQKIGIDVHANTGGAETGVRKIDTAAAGAAESVSEISEAADKAGASIDKLAGRADKLAESAKRAADATVRQGQYTVQRLTELQKQLENVLGRPISIGDARTAALNFESNRARNKFRGRTVQDADDYVDYLGTSGLAAQNNGHRRAYRNEVIYSSMKGTQAAQQGGVTPPEQPPEPRGGGGGGNERGVVERGQSAAMAFGKSMLALAGRTSIMGMAGQAVDMANEESIGLDTLKRRSGDLGVGFDKLQGQVRAATDGMGMTYVESVRLAQQYAKVAGTFASASGERTGIGFSRAFGIDPTQGVDFMANMRRLRATGDDEKSQHRLALMIGEAVTKSGYSGKADELLAAVSNFASDVARQTLSTPNIADIAGYLTTLTKTGYAGLDPQGAMSLLATADRTSRSGGGVGDASKNFQYAALANASPGMSIIQAGALWQSGLFGTTRGTFSKGTPFGDFESSNGIKTPGLNDVTNLQKYMGMMEHMYPGKGKNKEWMIDAIQNQFGLSSYSQAAAFYGMAKSGPENLGESARLISAAHIDPSKLNDVGIYGVGNVAGANSTGALRGIYSKLMQRTDLKYSGTDKADLDRAMGGNNVEAMKLALTRVIATNGQETTPGSELRESIADLKNELTRVGNAMIGLLDPIRFAVVAMAETLAPQKYKEEQQRKADAATDFAKKAANSGYASTAFDNRFGDVDSAYSKNGGGYKGADDAAPYPRSVNKGTSDYSFDVAANRYARGVAGAQALKLTDEQRQKIASVSSGDKSEMAFLEAWLRTENRGQGHV